VNRTLPTTGAAVQLAAWWSVVELCLPSHRRGGSATFRPAGPETLAADWEAWLDGVFRPVLDPALASLAAAANEGDAGAVLAADRRLGCNLSPVEAAASLRAGRTALLDHEPPRGARLLDRLRAVARADDTCGHLATIFAARGQAFHLPAVQLRGAFLLAECVGGSAAAGITLAADAAAVMMESGLAGKTAAPAARLAAL
jgi:hypothetical protein